MPKRDYNNAKIYKLCSDVDDCFYIGSTCNSLAKRLSHHKYDASRRAEIKVYKHFNRIGLGEMKIILIEKCDVNDKDELLRVEDRHIKDNIKNPNCLNSWRAKRSFAEWKEEERDAYLERKRKFYQRHKDEILEKHKEYREKNRDSMVDYLKEYYAQNKESLLEKQRQKIQCPICQCEVRRYAFKRHERTPKHKLNLQEVKSI